MSSNHELSTHELAKPLRIVMFRILPVGITASVILGVIIWLLGVFNLLSGSERFALIVAEISSLLTVSVAALYVSLRSLKRWFRRPSVSETNTHHERFRLVMNGAIFVTICSVVATLLALVILGLDMQTIIEIAGAVVLLATIAVLAICSRYTGVSFSTDFSRLIEELQASSESMVRSYQSMGEQLSTELHNSMTEVSQRLQEQGERQASSMESLTRAIDGLAEKYEDVAREAEDMRRIQEEAAEEAREARRKEEERVEAQKEREEQERIRIMPRPRVGMSWTGTIFHHLVVQVFNDGMPGYNLRVTIQVREQRPFTVSAPSIRSQELKTWDIGDVSGYYTSERFSMTVRLSDARGREYTFRQEFEYRRELSGFWRRTLGIAFTPSGLTRPQLADE
jgi:hypothetical protein